MPGDSHPLPDRGRRGSPRGRPPSNNTRRPSTLPHSLAYPSSSPHSPSEVVQNTAIASPTSPYHQSPSGYPPPLVPYPPQRHGYVGHYGIPTAMRMGPTPSFPYAFPHSENAMLQPPIHAGYAPMMQHHPQTMYSYQRGSPEGAAPHPSYPTAGPSHLYQMDPSRAAHSPMSPQGTSTPPTYAGTSPFHSLHYAPHNTPPYTYSSQSFPTTPTHYQAPPYPSPPYYSTSSPDHEHGTWFYFPPQPQSAGHPQYSRPYAVPFTLRPEAEPSYNPANAAPSSSASGITYQTPPPRPHPTSEPRVPSPTRSPEASDRPPPSSTPSNPRQSPPPNFRGDRAAVRRPYHPNPPAHRSEWVMWAGNVPSDASHDEAWRFFTSLPEDSPPDHPPRNGVVSIFLISRSCCVFVNFDSSDHLKAGIERFNGTPLRPHDPRCPRLVCRERGKGDDLKAGVGGQRGSGMHMRWVKEQKAKGKERGTSYSSDEPPTSPSVSEYLSRASISSDDDPHATRATKQSQSSSSGSFASTTSSLLVRHFPQRFFILKSLTQFDLDLSVEKGLWATQKHNEEILDQAFRTSKEVFLIFGVNKSGEFYGYARMAGPLRNGEQDVSWASRTDSSSSSRSAVGLQQEVIVEESGSPSYLSEKPFFSPGEGRLVDKSPGAFSPDTHVKRDTKSSSAPPTTGHHPKLSLSPLSDQHSLDPVTARQIQSVLTARPAPQSREFRLDADAPLRAARGDSGHEDESLSKLGPVVEVEEGAEAPVAGAERDPTWGDAFKVEWLCTQRLPFHRTRQLRNPWNHGKEIKVSRDGTELEPGVGRQLLEEWALYVKELASGEVLPDPGPAKPRPMGPSKTAPAVPTIRSQGPSNALKGEPEERTQGGSRS